MSSNPIFVGRREETEAFARWIGSDCESTGDKRAAVPVGLPPVESGFYASGLGAVLFGIGIAFCVEWKRRDEGLIGLGLVDTITINLCGGLCLPVPNPDQLGSNANGVGDACETVDFVLNGTGPGEVVDAPPPIIYLARASRQ